MKDSTGIESFLLNKNMDPEQREYIVKKFEEYSLDSKLRAERLEKINQMINDAVAEKKAEDSNK